MEKEALAKKLEESCRQDTSKDTIRDTSKDASKDTSANSSNQETFDSLRNRLKALEAENAQLKVHFYIFSGHPLAYLALYDKVTIFWGPGTFFLFFGSPLGPYFSVSG